MARVFRPAVRRAQLAPLRFHDLRHTYAALMVAAGAHPKLLQAQLGHTSINVTLNTYGHLFPDAFADVGTALDRLVDVARRDADSADVGRSVKVREILDASRRRRVGGRDDAGKPSAAQAPHKAGSRHGRRKGSDDLHPKTAASILRQAGLRR